MDGVAIGQVLSLCAIVSWIVVSSFFGITHIIRSLLQPWVLRRVISGTPTVLQIQGRRHQILDAFFSGLSCVVSVPFYTAFLPLLFWVVLSLSISICCLSSESISNMRTFGIILQSGHGRLARQMTLLIATCDYLGNCIKDVVSAPRPSCPPVKRITATKDEEDNALEYGFPSSHTLNTVCLSGYLLHYFLSYTQNEDVFVMFAGISLVCLLVGLIGLGRIYLGMHSLVDVIGGLAFGLVVLAFWLTVHDYADNFIVSGQNVTSFWAALSFLLLFAYPTPEFPTPSFAYHTAFNGVALGIVVGVQQTYNQFHHEAVPRIFTSQLTFLAFVGRMLVGIPTILLVKFCSKSLAKWILPIVSNILGIPIKSTNYIPTLNGLTADKKSDDIKPSGYLQKLLFFSNQRLFDIDTGIRFLQYAGLAWSVVDLVPSLFGHLSL